MNPGDNIKLSCMAVGNPTPEIRWLHGNKVVQASDARYFIDRDGTLMIERAVLGDDGAYMCEANNGVGEPVTASTTVDVLGENILRGNIFHICSIYVYPVSGWRSSKRVPVEDLGNNRHPSACMS